MKSSFPVNCCVLAAGLFMAENEAARAAQLNMAQQPLILSPSLAPNLILTLDSSNSMKRAFVPDALGYADDALRDTRRVKAASFNPLYYDPAIHYRVPKRILFRNGELLSSDYPVSAGEGFDFTRVYVNGFNSARGTLDLSSDYRVAWEYDPARGQDRDYDAASRYARPMGSLRYLAENPAADFRGGGWHDMTRAGVAAYYYLYDPALAAGCTAQNDDCYRLVTVSENSDPGGGDERQNFAIWYAFYRNRALAMQSATNLAFSGLPESIRFTWQDLHRCGELDSAGACNGNAQRGGNLFRRFAAEQRANFFAWLGDLAYTGDSPLPAALERAGRFISGERSPAYDLEPGATREPRYACRPSFHLMMSDGLWNAGGASLGNLDGSALSLPDRTRYQPRPPFRDAADGTLADLAFQYWASDAQPALADRLKPHIRAPQADAGRQYWDPRNDPATWQHLVTFTVGMAPGRSLVQPQWGGGTFSGPGYAALASGDVAWPEAAAGRPDNVYDLWHAALNGRGEFLSVDDPQQSAEALAGLLSRIASSRASASRPVLQFVPADARGERYRYVASFSSQDWSGDLSKYRQGASSEPQERLWSATALLDERRESRRILMRGADGALSDLAWSNLSAAQRVAFNRRLDGTLDGWGKRRLDYLRGARADEGTLFRPRAGLLGDIVNSSPLLVAAPARGAQLLDRLESPHKGGLSASERSYSEFKAARAHRPAMIYVGANDGMLHAFDAASGEEVFAFVPSALLAELYRLADPGYGAARHRYFVDGPLVSEDVFFDGDWHTVLVGSLGAGGRGLFALDISAPASPSLLWEIDAGGDYADLGYGLPRPVIVRLHNGRWALLAANGYDSQRDVAALLIIDIADGRVIKSIPLAERQPGANGLSSPRAVDIDGDGIVDYAYAGDLRGHLWRFDLFNGTSEQPFGGANSATAEDFRVAFGGRPLFVARADDGALQPITSAPWLIRHPTGNGLLALFGTGKYFEPADAQLDAARRMSLYGIWDPHTAGVTALAPPPIERDDLQRQTLVEARSDGRAARTLSGRPPLWYDGSGPNARIRHYGWYVDLPGQGERIVADPVGSGRLLLVSTLTPNADPCADGLNSWLLALNPSTGGAPLQDALDRNRDGQIDERDRVERERVVAVEFPSAPAGFAIGFEGESGLGVASGAEESLRFFDGIRPGRQSWRVMENGE
ncbi:pilus assembly protein [Pseudomonas panipatensis]|uniref:pilus assembly protein n=1 Tax=Pseudomonas panipatensis TaxID=428992 RepID=UPI0035B37735